MAAPIPPGESKSRAMSRQRSRDTLPELAIRRLLHARGLRYRVHRPLIPSLRRNVDIVFPSARVAVDIRGCFWHACPEHATLPASNADWWARKLQGNKERDLDTELRVREAGWELVVVWEHEDPTEAADRIEGLVKARTVAGAPSRGKP